MKDTSLNKTIPRSAEAEAAILGAVLMDNRSLKMNVYQSSARMIFLL